MKTLNLSIVDKDQSELESLLFDIKARFGPKVKVTSYPDSETFLHHINDLTDVVVLAEDYGTEKSAGKPDIIQSIKRLNPSTKIVIYSAVSEVAVMIEAMRKGAADYIVKGKNSQRRLILLIKRFLAGPVQSMLREMGVIKFQKLLLILALLILITVILFLSFGVIQFPQ